MPGYSLFELLVVLAVIAFAAMLAPPAVNALRPELQTEKIADELAGELRLARSRAVTSGEPIEFAVELDGGGLRLGAATNDAGWIAVPGDIIVTLGDRSPAALSETGGGGHDIVFYPDGSASGLDVRIAGKRSIWRVTTSLNGRTTAAKESD